MSGTIPPIPPPFGTSSGNPGSPNVNRVDTMPTTTDPINTTTTTNVSQSVVDENLPQLLDSRGGSHVTNVPAFDKEDFTSWKVRFLVFLNELEPYLLKTLEDGPFVPMSSLSTSENPCLNVKINGQMLRVCKTAKEMYKDLILAHEGPSDTRDTKIAALRLKFNAFKSLEGEKVNETFTSLPRKWLSMNQTQRANNSIKNDSLATLYGKYNYEEGLIDQIYESETQRFTIHASSSKALISNHQFQASDSDVEEDQRTSNEFMADLNAEYHERALLANQKRFYKRCGRVGSARKPLDKTKETCFACGKLGHFQKDCPSHKTSTPSYPSSNNSFNKSKPYTPSFNQTSSQNSGNHQKDYKRKYKGLKAEMAVLTKRIDDMTKGKSEKGKKEKEKSEKGLLAESFDWDDESVSSDNEGSTKIRAFMAIAEDEPSVGKVDARSGQWVDITMKKVYRLFPMTDGDERKHVLDYTHVDLQYVEDQRKNLVSKFNLLKQEISLHNKVTLDQLLSEQVPGNIVKALGGKGRRKEKISSKEVVFTKADESSSVLAPEITSDSESECDSKEPFPPLPKLIGATPSGTSESLISLSDLTLNMADLTLDTPDPKKTRPSVKVSPAYVIKKKTKKSPAGLKPCSDKKADSSTEQLLLTLIEDVKGLKRQIEIPSSAPPSSSQQSSSEASKQKTWFGPCKHCGFRNHLSDDSYSKPKCSTCGSTDHLTKEHLEYVAVKKTLSKLKAQTPLKPLPKMAPMIPKPFIECKYCGFNDHHSDHCEFYPGYEVCGSIAHEASDCPKKYPNSRRPRIANRQSEPTEKYSKESGPKVVFGDDSSGDTEGYGSVNCNGITFTRVAYVNGLKHNLISISQLCDANYKVLFTKTQGTIYNQNDEVVLIAPRRRDVYVIDMSSFNKESNACFFAKASPSVNWLWHKRLSHLNFKNINNLAKHNPVSVLPSLTFSKDKKCSACEKGKHHRASFKTKRSFSINKSLHLLYMDFFGLVKPQTISHNKYTLVIVDEY
ncbi:retrovirus-related pol polyprotein from transposon TNT 1-94 [Tanacetum coccineum]